MGEQGDQGRPLREKTNRHYFVPDNKEAIALYFSHFPQSISYV